MKKLLLVVVFLIIAPSCFAQLTQEQKVTDFKALVGLYDKNYGPPTNGKNSSSASISFASSPGSMKCAIPAPI
jgi:hypothetical protein